jgi:hypothetical protein
MVGAWKSDEDLYRIGCFLSANQTDRVCVERKPSGQWQIVSDGTLVESLSLTEHPQIVDIRDPDEVSPVFTRLVGLLRECEYSIAADSVSGVIGLPGDPPLRVILASDSRTVEFVACIELSKRGKKSHQSQFVMAVLQERLRCQLHLKEFPIVEVSRDQLLRDINHDEVVDHVKAVRAAALRVEQIWNEQVTPTKRSKSNSGMNHAEVPDDSSK